MAKLLDFIPGYKAKPEPSNALPTSKIVRADNVEKYLAGYNAADAMVVVELVARRLRVRELEEALLAATPPQGNA